MPLRQKFPTLWQKAERHGRRQGDRDHIGYERRQGHRPDCEKLSRHDVDRRAGGDEERLDRAALLFTGDRIDGRVERAGHRQHGQQHEHASSGRWQDAPRGNRARRIHLPSEADIDRIEHALRQTGPIDPSPSGIVGQAPRHRGELLPHPRWQHFRVGSPRLDREGAIAIELIEHLLGDVDPQVGLTGFNGGPGLFGRPKSKGDGGRPVVLGPTLFRLLQSAHAGCQGLRIPLRACKHDHQIGGRRPGVDVGERRPHPEGAGERKNGIHRHWQQKCDEQRATVSDELEQVATGQRQPRLGPQAAGFLAVRRAAIVGGAHDAAPAAIAAKNASSRLPWGPRISEGVPCATIRPPSMITNRSQRRSIS